MRTAITISLPEKEAKQVRQKAKQLGYPSVSGFIRAQITDALEAATFTDEDILKTARAADRRAAKGELPELTSIADLLKQEGLQ